jgi:hypothetical protein
LRDLYVLGDFAKNEYTYRRQLLQQELAALEPPVVDDAEEAAATLTNFALLWEREQDAKKRNKLLRSVFESLTQGELVAVTPRKASLPYFSFEVGGAKYGSDGTRTRDLRRDRPVLALTGWAGICWDCRGEQGFPTVALWVRRVPAGASGDLLRDERGMLRCLSGKLTGSVRDAVLVAASAANCSSSVRTLAQATFAELGDSSARLLQA